jgi:hypothetical protein
MTALKEAIVAIISIFLGMFDERIDVTVDVLTLDFFNTPSTENSMLLIAIVIQNVIRPIALTICVICFLIQFIKLTVTMNMLKWEYILKALLGLVLTRVAMDVSQSLLAGIYGTAAIWIRGAWGGGNAATTLLVNGITNAVDTLRWGEALIFMVMMILVLLLVVLVGVGTVVMAYARTFELLFWIAVSPIACAFLPLEDNRIFKQYIFRFAGTALSGLGIIITIRLYVMFMNYIALPLAGAAIGIADAITRAVSLTSIMVTGVILLAIGVTKSGQWAKSLFDAA